MKFMCNLLQTFLPVALLLLSILQMVSCSTTQINKVSLSELELIDFNTSEEVILSPASRAQLTPYLRKVSGLIKSLLNSKVEILVVAPEYIVFIGFHKGQEPNTSTVVFSTSRTSFLGTYDKKQIYVELYSTGMLSSTRKLEESSSDSKPYFLSKETHYELLSMLNTDIPKSYGFMTSFLELFSPSFWKERLIDAPVNMGFHLADKVLVQPVKHVTLKSQGLIGRLFYSHSFEYFLTEKGLDDFQKRLKHGRVYKFSSQEELIKTRKTLALSVGIKTSDIKRMAKAGFLEGEQFYNYEINHEIVLYKNTAGELSFLGVTVMVHPESKKVIMYYYTAVLDDFLTNNIGFIYEHDIYLIQSGKGLTKSRGVYDKSFWPLRNQFMENSIKNLFSVYNERANRDLLASIEKSKDDRYRDIFNGAFDGSLEIKKDVQIEEFVPEVSEKDLEGQKQ